MGSLEGSLQACRNHQGRQSGAGQRPLSITNNDQIKHFASEKLSPFALGEPALISPLPESCSHLVLAGLGSTHPIPWVQTSPSASSIPGVHLSGRTSPSCDSGATQGDPGCHYSVTPLGKRTDQPWLDIPQTPSHGFVDTLAMFEGNLGR